MEGEFFPFLLLQFVEGKERGRGGNWPMARRRYIIGEEWGDRDGESEEWRDWFGDGHAGKEVGACLLMGQCSASRQMTS